MASRRIAVRFVYAASAFLIVSSANSLVFASPLLPPELPALDMPDVSVSIAARPATLDLTPTLDFATSAAATTAANTAPAAGSATGSGQAGSGQADYDRQPRRVLADFAMKLRNIAYRRGGRDLTTGFDCSGFVRYVFRHSLGLDLPSDSASQFQAGAQVDRDELKMGDLVFFRTHGRRISHVGIYLDNGLFIHSPSNGKRVRIDHLAEGYWAKRFVGAKRQDGLS